MREQQLAGIGAGVPRRAEVREADEESGGSGIRLTLSGLVVTCVAPSSVIAAN
jgi:hypothetical protein